MKGKRGLLAAILMVSVFLVACASGSQTPAPKAAAPAPAAPAPAAPATPAPAQKAPTPAPAAPVKVQQLSMGTTGSSSSHYGYLVAAAKSINNKYKAVNVTPFESGASRDNLARMAKGEFDLGLSDNASAYLAYNGLDEFKGKEMKDLRRMWMYTTAAVTYVASKDSGITNMEGLQGKTMSPGQVGSAMTVMAVNAMKTMGIEPKYYYGSFGDSVNAMKDRQIVGFAKLAASLSTPDSAIMEIQASLPLNFFGFTEEHIRKIQAVYPYYQAFTLKSGMYQGQTQALRSIGFTTGVVGTAKMSEEMGYNIVKSVFEDKAEQAKVFKAINEFEYGPLTAEGALIPLHAGVVKYLKEKGINVPAKLIPPEYKG